MSYTITEIEDAILDALDPLRASLGVRTLKTYGGELDVETVQELAFNFPAVFVVYAGENDEEHGPRKIDTLEFNVVTADRNLRAEDEARRGSAQNPGAYALVDAVRDALYGQTFGLEISPVKRLGVEVVAVGKGLAIYLSRFNLAHAYTLTGL